MAVTDKARVRTRLVGLYPTVAGFTNERLDALAAKLKATDDSTDEDIDAELTSINDNGMFSFEQIKKEDDRVRNALAKKPVETPATPATPPKEEDTSLEARLARMEKEIAERDARDAQRNLATKFASDPRLKGVPASWVKNNTPKSEEDFEDSVTALADEYGKFATEHKLEKITGSDTPPAATSKKDGEVKQVSMEDAKAIAARLTK